MTAKVTGIWRHPIKSHGREALDEVALSTGQTMPWDRTWAVAHEASQADGVTWVHCSNFCRVAKAPSLMAITAHFDAVAEQITLCHPDHPDISFRPDTDPDAFIQWVRPLVPANRPGPARLVRSVGRGMTDSDFPSVTLCNMASHVAVEQKLGQALSPHRWRGNIWIDGLSPWEEFDWIGRHVQIGKAVLAVRERTKRCIATSTNPSTGVRDVDMLGTLSGWGHTDFSVRAEVIEGGRINATSTVQLLA